MAQRLVRSICPDCKQEYLPDLDKLPSDLKLEPGRKLYRGAGCRKCRGTGFHGRTGLYELMVADDDVREKIMVRAQASEILKVAKTAGLRTIREDGWIKVRQGVTTPEEVMRVAVV